VQVLLDDPDADRRLTQRLDRLVGRATPDSPHLQLLADAHATRRYYERPELPADPPRAEPDPDAAPPPRPARPEQDFHTRAASFGSTPALLRRLGLAVDLVLADLDAEQARAALAGAEWISIQIASADPDLQVLPPRRTAVVVDGARFAARSTDAWVGGALPLGRDEWVVLDTDPDASGLKLDQYARNLGRQYASEANGDPATSAPGTLRATGFAIARRERAEVLRERVRQAETLAADPGRDLLLDDLVRGIRVEVWDDASREWHSVHRRRVTVTAEPGGHTVLAAEPDAGFLQLSALNRPPDSASGYYVHEVVAGWDGWSLSAPRPGLTVVHVESPNPDDPTEQVVAVPPDPPPDGAHIVSRVEPGSLPRLRYGTSYSFRVLAVDLAGNSVPHTPAGAGPAGAQPVPGQPITDQAAVADAAAHLDRLRESYARRDSAGVAAALRRHLLADAAAAASAEADAGGAEPVPLLPSSGDPQVDAELSRLLAAAKADPHAADAQTAPPAAGLARAERALAAEREIPRLRPQLQVDPQALADLARHHDLDLPEGLRRAGSGIATAPRPYLRWDPVPPPVVVPRHPLGLGEQPASLVVRSGVPDGGAGPAGTSQRHLAPPKGTQAEAETAGLFDDAIGTTDPAQIKRLYALALAERGTLLDQFAPDRSDPHGSVEQPGIALVDRPGADTDPQRHATLADIANDRGRPLGEGQYVVHDTDALYLPYLADPFADGVCLLFTTAGAPHALVEPRALQSVTVPYPGSWPDLQPLRLVLQPGDALGAQVVGHEVRVSLPPGEQVRLAVSSTLRLTDLDNFGLWRSHLGSVTDPSDGYTDQELLALVTLQRAASAGWTWWLTPAEELRLVHAVPQPVRPPQLRGLGVFLRPAGRAVAALTGLVDVHGPSTDTLVVRATWDEPVDDPASPAPALLTGKSDVVVRSPVGPEQRVGLLFLADLQPVGPLQAAFDGIGLHRMIHTFDDTKYRRVTYRPSGTTRYAEYFSPQDLPAQPAQGDPVTLDIPASARPAAPQVLDALPLLRWSAQPAPHDPFGWRQQRLSGIRVWLSRPWYSSGAGELLGVLLFDSNRWVQENGRWAGRPKPQQVPDGATSLWAADPIIHSGGAVSGATTPPLLRTEHLLLDALETSVSAPDGPTPPLAGRPQGGSDRGWPQAPGDPTTVAAEVPLIDIAGAPAVRVLGYTPQFDPDSGRWFADINVHQTPALWPFVRLALARYQPHAIAGCELSPVALSGWVQPLPARTLTVTRPHAQQVQVTLTGVVGRLRPPSHQDLGLPGDQITPDAPSGEAASAAALLQQSRTVTASIQQRPAGGGDLDWRTVAGVRIPAVAVPQDGQFTATWTGSVPLPPSSGTPEGEQNGLPALRRPGAPDSDWRVLIEEHELFDADPGPDGASKVTARLVYADTVGL
jgi:hypothetical protein